MNAPENILTTWRKFDDFPMETLTKAWLVHERREKKQRDVSQMKEHRMQFGITGNCFDLCLWLLDEFKKDGITAYPVGHNLKTEHAHVAVIALDEHGNRYLCDLGDQWLTPILIDYLSDNYTEEMLSGFFPAAKVQVHTNDNFTEILYHRPNGKVSKQTYHLDQIEIRYFIEAAQFSQNVIKPSPLLECRIPYKDEIAHWEFYNWESFLSTTEGIYFDPIMDTLKSLTKLIHKKTGYDQKFLMEALAIYHRLRENR